MTTTVHVISHTHWDREWYLTFEQYRARLVDLVDAVLDRMERDARFTFFHLDGQSIVLEDYLEIRPEREAEIRRRVTEGRLLVGPWFVMPDMFLVSGESLVRNLARGIATAEGFGRSMRAGYIPDPFGHVSQMPQILSRMGLDGAILWRGFGGRRAEYRWRSPDGSEVLLSHLPPDGYCNGLRLPLVTGDDFYRNTTAVIEHERARSSSQQVLLMVGVDHVEPHPRLMELVDFINTMPDTRAEISTLPAFVRGVREDVLVARLDLVEGELRGGQDYAHLLPGVFSARTYLKQANARAERELEQWAEPLAVMAALGGADVPHGTLAYAWRTLLQNHPHDSICGCSIDAVHDENMTRFAKVQQVVDGVAQRAMQSLASRVPAGPEGALRAIAINTSAARWLGVFETEVDLPVGPDVGFQPVDYTVLDEPVPFLGDDPALAAVTDAEGHALPFQVLSTADVVDFRMSRFAPPPGLRVRRMRVAIDAPVPPMGYTVVDFHVGHERRPIKGRPTDGENAVGEQGAGGQGAGEDGPCRVESPVTLENGVLRVSWGGGAAAVLDKRTGVEYREVFQLEDVGDVGDEYNYSPPTTDARVTSAMARDVGTRVVDDGPLTCALEISYTLDVPEKAAPDRRRRSATHAALACVMQVRIRKGSPAVECRLRVTNTARDHRLRLLCGTSAARVDHHRADSAFDVVTRAARVEAADLMPVAGAGSAPDRTLTPPRTLTPTSTPTRTRTPTRTLTELPVATAPMQSFVDAGDDQQGAVVVADGLPEFEVVHQGPCAAIAVTLLRSVGDLSRNDLATRRGHAGPGLSTPGAQCLGTQDFLLTFVPRSGPPSEEALYALARAALLPPRLHQATAGDGTAPAQQSFFAVEASAGAPPILSACKPAGDRRSAILRFFNPSASSTTASLLLWPSAGGAYSVDLLERRGDREIVKSGRMAIEVAPHAIATFEIVMPERGRRDA